MNITGVIYLQAGHLNTEKMNRGMRIYIMEVQTSWQLSVNFKKGNQNVHMNQEEQACVVETVF